MTNATQPKPTPIPAIIVYGAPTSAELTQASWFRAEDIQAAKAAAVGLNFSVLELKADADKALAVGVHEGVLKGSGRMIVGSVTTEVYRRIEDYARNASGGATSPSPANSETTAGMAASEQTMNLATAGAAPSAPVPITAAPASPNSKPVAAASPAPTPPAKPACSATIWMGTRRGSGMYFDTRGGLMIVAPLFIAVDFGD